MEARHYQNEERKACQLQRQPSNQYTLSYLHRTAFPIIAGRDPTPSTLDEKSDDVESDEDTGELGVGNTVDMCFMCGKDTETETGDEEVVPGADEKGGDYDEDCLEGVGCLSLSAFRPFASSPPSTRRRWEWKWQ